MDDLRAAATAYAKGLTAYHMDPEALLNDDDLAALDDLSSAEIRIAALRALADQCEAEIASTITKARESIGGPSWRDIGNALGVTRAAAQQRYGGTN